jgi:uncharacterized protein YkwD
VPYRHLARRCAVLGAVAVASIPAIAPSHASARPKLETGVLRQINHARAAHGLPAVHASRNLAVAAGNHSGELLRTGRFSHIALDGSTVVQRLAHVAHGPVGEVIAWNSRRSSKAVVNQWLRSAPHRAVLLDGRFRRVGVGAARGVRGPRAGVLVTADFARR